MASPPPSSSSSDDEGEVAEARRGRPEKAPVIDLSGCAASPPSPAACADDGSEEVFEIRDFTAASPFERISHQIALACKKWAALRRSEPDTTFRQLDFELEPYTYNLLFQVASEDRGPGSIPADLCAFSPQVHRLQQWFGVQHFVTASVRGQRIDIDVARTILSAALLASQSTSPALDPPLSCFVPLGDKRYLGERLAQGARTAYAVDSCRHVPESLEHLEGLQAFFCKKFAVSAGELGRSLRVGARFTYMAEHFDAWRRRPGEGHEEEEAEGGARAYEEELDPVRSLELHCVWPSFPQGAFADNASYSELDPRAAPAWRLRLRRQAKGSPPLTENLRRLLSFRKEAFEVRSAASSLHTQTPKGALSALKGAMLKGLESWLVPSEEEVRDMVEECLACPVASEPDHSGLLAALRGGNSGGRMARFAALSAKMQCFRGVVLLWCRLVAELRAQWDGGAAADDAPAVVTHCVPERGVRTEHLDFSSCLAQQMFEVLQQSMRERGAVATVAAGDGAAPLRLQGSGEAVVLPALLRPALMAQDALLRLDMAGASIEDPAERAELHGRELRSDASAFRAANPAAQLEDFLAWRQETLGLSLEPFPRDWLAALWEAAPPRPAESQSSLLFDPERESEMALHYLENVEGTQLLLQVFRVHFRASLGELAAAVRPGAPAQLRVLRDRAASVALRAFSGRGEAEGGVEADAVGTLVGEVDDFPCEEALEAALGALEAFEAGVRLDASLHAKFEGVAGPLIDDLIVHDEALVASSAQRGVVERIFNRSRAVSQAQGRGRPDGRGVFEVVPHAKEFVLSLQAARDSEPRGGAPRGSGLARRMYVQVREKHFRMATARGLEVA